MEPISVLNTRPEPQASRFAADLLASFGQGLRLISAPLMRAVFLAPELPAAPFQALILTSETGAEAASRLKGAQDLPKLAYCVGDRTAEAARAQGFQPVSAKGDAGDLLRLLQDQGGQGPMLYLHGEDRAADLAAALAPSGLQVCALAVYRQEAQPLSAEARAQLGAGGAVIVPLFSPRSARLFGLAAQGLPSGDWQPVVISENTRAALSPALAQRAVLAARPDGPAMMTAIARCFPQSLA